MAGFTREDFEDVYSTARMAHMGQKRRSGGEYFTHPSEVRNIVRKYYPDDYAAQMVALLHDSLEDAPGQTVDSIDEMESFIRGSIADPSSGQEVIDAVHSLTHEKGSDYGSYVISLLNNPLALRVKLADMLHNLSTSPSAKQKKKYEDALSTASDVAGGVPNHINPQHWDDLTSLTETTGRRTLRLLIREYMKSVSTIEKGCTVRCTETGRVGIVLEKRRGADCMYARVLWDTNETTLTETVELELISQ
tara:strand:- start:21 stop:767 length:747 start_codon:yes stop_codon:yes gene_type:complete